MSDKINQLPVLHRDGCKSHYCLRYYSLSVPLYSELWVKHESNRIVTGLLLFCRLPNGNNWRVPFKWMEENIQSKYEKKIEFFFTSRNFETVQMNILLCSSIILCVYFHTHTHKKLIVSYNNYDGIRFDLNMYLINIYETAESKARSLNRIYSNTLPSI